jgi:hypothetical protein
MEPALPVQDFGQRKITKSIVAASVALVLGVTAAAASRWR